MSLSNKSPSTQMFRMMLYQRALHPELFKIQDRRTLRHGDYELECWIMPAGHAIRFQLEGHCTAEIVSEQDLVLPDRGLVQSIPCIGEKEHEEQVGNEISFVTAVQTENLSDNLYMATLDEMRDFATEAEAMSYAWTDDDGGQCLSILDVQRFKREVHAQSYHLIANNGFVLRTQSIFEKL